MEEWCTQIGEHVLIKICLQPGAKKNIFHGIYRGMIKLSVQAAPVEGRANEALMNWVMKILKRRRRDVILKKGHVSRFKIIVIKNISKEKVRSALGFSDDVSLSSD